MLPQRRPANDCWVEFTICRVPKDHHLPPPPGHQPATLEVHGLIASILAQMDVLDFMERHFVAEVHADFIEKLEAAEIDTKQKRKKLLDACAEELFVLLDASMKLVAGAGFEPAAFRL